MCTVTYIPTGENEFIFTSNRDETPKRSATGITNEKRGKKTLLFPRDPKANGTWIATSDANQLICILNGAFEKHKHRPPYRLSRGVMGLDFFSYKDANAFFTQFEFEGIEPFTLIIFDNGQLFDVRWDETLLHVEEKAIDQSHIWSSCTLYTEEWQEKRRHWFADWQRENKTISQSGILSFHKNGGEGNPAYDVVMNRLNIVRTTSITSVVKKKKETEMRFEDLLTGEVVRESFPL